MRMLMRAAILCTMAVAIVVGFSHSVRGVGPPPSIDDLDGTRWMVTASGTEYDLASSRGSTPSEIEWQISKSGPDTVTLNNVFGGMLFSLRYRGGFLLQSRADGNVPPNEGSLVYLTVTGTPGKLKMKGQLTDFSVGAGYDHLRIMKISAKQIPNP